MKKNGTPKLDTPLSRHRFCGYSSGEIDTLFDQVFVDTIAGFQAIRSFDLSLTANTVFTGIFNVSQSKLMAIRHVMKPSVSYTYRPTG